MLELGNSPLPLYSFEEPLGSVLLTSLGSISPIQELLDDARQWFTAISTTVYPEVAPNGQASAHTISVVFWLHDERYPIYSILVSAPISWSPRTYLAALKLTIQRRRMVIAAPDMAFGSLRATLNEVHWMFLLPFSECLEILGQENAFSRVTGGVEETEEN